MRFVPWVAIACAACGAQDAGGGSTGAEGEQAGPEIGEDQPSPYDEAGRRAVTQNDPPCKPGDHVQQPVACTCGPPLFVNPKQRCVAAPGSCAPNQNVINPPGCLCNVDPNTGAGRVVDGNGNCVVRPAGACAANQSVIGPPATCTCWTPLTTNGGTLCVAPAGNACLPGEPPAAARNCACNPPMIVNAEGLCVAPISPPPNQGRDCVPGQNVIGPPACACPAPMEVRRGTCVPRPPACAPNDPVDGDQNRAMCTCNPPMRNVAGNCLPPN